MRFLIFHAIPLTDIMTGGCMTIREMEEGSTGIITDVVNDDDAVVRRLTAMGFVPGRKVRLLRRISEKGARIVELGNSEMALDSSTAASVIMEAV